MSYVSTFNALNTTNTTAGQKLVLSVIASFERAGSGKAWPSVATIAKRCSLSVRSVNYHIASLIKLGYIQRIYRTGRSAITRLFIGETSAISAVPTSAKVAEKSVIPESVNQIQRVAETATPEPSTETATPIFFVSDLPEQPQTEPQHQAPAIQEIEQPSISTLEASFEALVPFPVPLQDYPATYTPAPVVEAANPLAEGTGTTQAVEADPLAEVPAQLLVCLGEVRKAKKRPAKPTKTEAALWWQEAVKAGWTMEQVITTMILHGWARFDASWVQNLPAHVQPGAPGRDSVFVPETFTPASPSAIARFKESWAKQRAQILADSARRREEQMGRPARP